MEITMSETPARILIAVDGSNESLDVVRYVGASAQPSGTEIVLYTVLGKIPETFWDSGKDSLWDVITSYSIHYTKLYE